MPGDIQDPRGGRATRVTFYGVRGSCPCSGEAIRRYGGATSCVAVDREVDGEPPLLLDLGTGARNLGEDLLGRSPAGAPLALSAFTTHLHFDHIQGLPFFAPALTEGTLIDVYGPTQPEKSLGRAFADIMRPPYFPVALEDLPATIRFHELDDGEVTVGGMTVTARRIPHVGATCGYRVQSDGAGVAYLSDHQAPKGPEQVSAAALELCKDVDLLIHDAQYTEEEFRGKPHWGHSTVAYALQVAADAGARRLVLFHHDPTHDDEDLDQLTREVAHMAERAGLEAVLVASEGLSLVVGEPVGGASR